MLCQFQGSLTCVLNFISKMLPTDVKYSFSEVVRLLLGKSVINLEFFAHRIYYSQI